MLIEMTTPTKHPSILENLEAIGDRVVGGLLLFVVFPLLALSALAIYFTADAIEPIVLPFVRVVICLLLLGLGIVLHLFKLRHPGWYGAFEIATGCAVNWINITAASQEHAIEKRLLVFLGGVYLTKRGIDSLAEPLKKQREIHAQGG